MGFDFGLSDLTTTFMLRNRWVMQIANVCGEIGVLPPFKSARPSFSFKEMEVKHLTESVFYPIRPEWKPIKLVLYDIKNPNISPNPIFSWLKSVYDPSQMKNNWTAPGDASFGTGTSEDMAFMKYATLTMYSGCGDAVEEIIYEDCWPKEIEWGELDMGSTEVVTVDVTLRYARAYFSMDQGTGAAEPRGPGGTFIGGPSIPILG